MEAKIEVPELDEELPGGMRQMWRMKDLMRFLQCNYTTAWQLIHQYGLPCYKFPKKTSPLRFDPQEVLEWREKYKTVLKPRSVEHTSNPMN